MQIMGEEDAMADLDPEKGATEPLTGSSGAAGDAGTKVTFTSSSPDGKASESVDIGVNGSGTTSSGYGLTKSEVLMYANDATWRKVRWSAFTLFWLLWFAMLAASVAIVATTRCG